MLFFLFLFFLWIFITFFKEAEKLKILGSWGLKINIPEINIIHLSSANFYKVSARNPTLCFRGQDLFYFIIMDFPKIS